MSRIALFAAFGLATVSVTPAVAQADGKDAFLEAKCNKCHSIDKLGVKKIVDEETGKEGKGPDLSDEGTKGHDAAWYKQWLKKEIEKESNEEKGKMVKHKKAWKGTDADLDTIVAFLQTLK